MQDDKPSDNKYNHLFLLPPEITENICKYLCTSDDKIQEAQFKQFIRDIKGGLISFGNQGPNIKAISIFILGAYLANIVYSRFSNFFKMMLFLAN